MGQALYCSAADAGVWGERGHGDVSIPYIYSAVLPCFHGCLAFLHRRLSSQSPPSHPLDLSLCNQQQSLPWDWCTILKLQLPAPAPSRGPVTLSGICVAVARTVRFSFLLDCRNNNPLQFSCLGNLIYWGASWTAVCGSKESQILLSTYKHTHTVGLQYFRYTAKWCDIFMYYTKVISILLTVLPVLYIILSVWGENVHELFWAVSAGDPGLLLLWYPWGPFTESYCIPWKKTWI